MEVSHGKRVWVTAGKGCLSVADRAVTFLVLPVSV